jgi:hypothetical protein
MIIGRAHAPTTNKMSWDNVNSWSQVAVVLFAVLALVSGLFVSARQAKDLASLKDSAATQEGKNLELEKANIVARKELADLRIKQAEAEKAIAPRVLVVLHTGDTTNVDALKRFAGREFVIRYIPDAEAMRAASCIEQVLTTAGLKVISRQASMEISGSWFEGVTVETYIKDLSGDSIWEARNNGTFVAAEGIVAFLKANNWEARTMMPGTSDIPPLAIRINIGFKPPPYFLQKEVQEFHDEIKAREKRFEEMRRKAEGEQYILRPRDEVASPSPNP